MNLISDFHLDKSIRAVIRAGLEALGKKDEETSIHSINVWSYVNRIHAYLQDHPEEAPAYEGLNRDLLFAAALLHDVGKADDSIPSELLHVKEATQEQLKILYSHSITGYHLVKKLFDDVVSKADDLAEIVAQVVVRIHRFQDNTYPSDEELPVARYTEDIIRGVEKHAKVISVADFYDACGRCEREKENNYWRLFGSEDLTRLSSAEKLKWAYRMRRAPVADLAERIIDAGVLKPLNIKDVFPLPIFRSSSAQAQPSFL